MGFLRQSVCGTRCDLQALGHAYRSEFDCTALSELYREFALLFQGARTLRAFLWQNDLCSVARFVYLGLGFVGPVPHVAGEDVGVVTVEE